MSNLLNAIYIAQRDAGEAACIANLERMGFKTEKPVVDFEALAKHAHATRLAAEKAWYELFCALPVGVDRSHANEVYERIRCATQRQT